MTRKINIYASFISIFNFHPLKRHKERIFFFCRFLISFFIYFSFLCQHNETSSFPFFEKKLISHSTFISPFPFDHWMKNRCCKSIDWIIDKVFNWKSEKRRRQTRNGCLINQSEKQQFIMKFQGFEENSAWCNDDLFYLL